MPIGRTFEIAIEYSELHLEFDSVTESRLGGRCGVSDPLAVPRGIRRYSAYSTVQ